MTFTKITTIPVGPIDIQIWGLLVALGMLAGLLYTLREAKKRKMNTENFIDIFIIIFVSAIVGSRLLYVAQFWQEYANDPMAIIKIQQGGLTFLGGVFLSVLALFIYTKLKKLSFWKVVDIMAPGFALGIGIGRIGCYLIGDHIGARTDFFLGSYYNGDLRHEPSLYLSINGFLLFFVLILLKPFLKNKEGALGYLFIAWYALSRFLLDFTRAADIEALSDPRYYGLTFSQWASLVLFVIFTPLLIRKLIPAKK
jgi:phosphatidylglycerol:prolipoprotein diacylglycerol transferase